MNETSDRTGSAQSHRYFRNCATSCLTISSSWSGSVEASGFTLTKKVGVDRTPIAFRSMTACDSNASRVVSNLPCSRAASRSWSTWSNAATAVIGPIAPSRKNERPNRFLQSQAKYKPDDIALTLIPRGRGLAARERSRNRWLSLSACFGHASGHRGHVPVKKSCTRAVGQSLTGLSQGSAGVKTRSQVGAAPPTEAEVTNRLRYRGPPASTMSSANRRAIFPQQPAFRWLS